MADQDMPGFRGMRYSKYRHVYGNPYRREKFYNNIPITKNSHDSNFCAVNPKFLAVILESQGGGSFLIIPINKFGRADALNNKITGHKSTVLDIKWNPFNDCEIASCSDDGTVKVWSISDDAVDVVNESNTSVIAELVKHTRRVLQIVWHPTATGILASSGQDGKLIVWDVEQQEPFRIIECHPDRIFCITFSFMGDMIGTTCKDKKIRIIDARSGEVLRTGSGHFGQKNSKIVFTDDGHYIITTGTNRSSTRELALRNLDDLSEPTAMVQIDSGTGVQLLFYDPDTKVAFVAGKGDGSIRYFEVNPEESPPIFRLNEFITSMPQCGIGTMPKRDMDQRQCEIMRFYKLHVSKGMVEPISMIVPRKSEAFQDDIYPPTVSNVPSLTAQSWMAGRDAPPSMVLLGNNRQMKTNQQPTAGYSLRQSVSKTKTTETSKEQINDNRSSSSSRYSKKSEEKSSRSSGSESSRGSYESGYSSPRHAERSSSRNEEYIVPASSSTVSSAPPPAAAYDNEDVSTLSEVSSISSTPSGESSAHSAPDGGKGSIASRMAMFESGGRRGWKRTASLDSAVQPTPNKFNLKDAIVEDEAAGVAYKDQVSSSRSPVHKSPAVRTLSTEPSESLPRELALDSGELVRSNGDGHEMSKTSRREFMTSKDLGMEQLRKAFLRQQEEIKQYKAQLMLRDQRIRQLEREIEELTMTSEV